MDIHDNITMAQNAAVLLNVSLCIYDLWLSIYCHLERSYELLENVLTGTQIVADCYYFCLPKYTKCGRRLQIFVGLITLLKKAFSSFEDLDFMSSYTKLQARHCCL